MNPRLHADLARPEYDRLVHPAHELLAWVLVGVRRAPALAEAAKCAPDDAHVRDVDVSIDHVGHDLAGELFAQLVGGLADLLDCAGAGLGEEGGQLLLAEPLAVARAGERAGHEVVTDRTVSAPPGAAPRDEAPVARLDHVEHTLLEPLRVHVLRVDTQPL